MKIKCENCSAEYEVADERLSIEQPHFFKCSACGFIFETVLGQEKITQEQSIPVIETSDVIPVVEQSDAVPMPLSEIFQPQEDVSFVENEKSQENTSRYDFEKDEPKDLSDDGHGLALFTSWDEADEFTPVSGQNKKHKRKLAVVLAIFVVFCLVLYLFYVGRYFFVRNFDFADNLYQKAGVSSDVTADGLAFQNTVFDTMAEKGTYTLLIKSQVINTTDQVQKLPMVLVNILDGTDKIVQKKEVSLGKQMLSPGEKIDFEARLSSLAGKARRIELTFKKEQK